MPQREILGGVDRLAIDEQVREAVRDWEDGRARLSEFEGDVGVIPLEPPLAEVDREVAIALNVALEMVSLEGLETRDIGLGRAGTLILNELAHRGLPIVSKSLWRAE